MTGTSLDVDLDVLVYGEDMHCQSPHEFSECTVTVVAVMTTCIQQILVCQGAADYIQDYIDKWAYHSICRDCTRLAETCWRLRWL